MNTQQILDYLKANDLGYNAGFARAETEGCIEECQDIFDSAYDKLEGYVLFGLNNGFTKGLKEGIESVTTFIVEVCGAKNGKGLAKLSKKLEEIDSTVAREMKNDNRNTDHNMVNKIVKYVDEYLSALEVKLGDSRVLRKDVLEMAKVKLQTLRECLEKVCDQCSLDAQAKAEKILPKLKKWAEDAANNMCSRESNALIDDALSVAMEWEACKTGVKLQGLFKKSWTISQNYESLNFVDDRFTILDEGQTAQEKIDMFRANLKNVEKIKRESFSTEEDETELASLKADKKMYEENLNQNDIDYDNGIVSEEDYISNYEEYKGEISELTKAITEKTKIISLTKKKFSTYNKAIRRLTWLDRVIRSLSDDPRTLLLIVNKIDFTKINNVLSGYASAEDIDHVLGLRKTVTLVEQYAQERMKLLLNEFDAMEAEENKLDEEETVVVEDPNRISEAKKRAEEIRRSRMKNKPIQTETSQTEQAEEANKMENFGDILDEN